MLYEMFGSWMEKHILPQLNAKLRERRGRLAEQARRCKPVSKNQLFKYFLNRFISGLEKHRKHNIPPSSLVAARTLLTGNNRARAIHACLDFGDHALKDIIGSIHSHLNQYVIAGSTSCCVDESIFPHYGRVAFEHSKLQYIMGKPFDYGMVAYLLAQRLLFSELTICLGICPTFLGDAPKPIDAALSLVTLLPSKNIILKHLIADSL